MSNVFSLAEKREAEKPHAHGEMICGGCGHTHEAVVPVGTMESECPKCGAMKCYHKHYAYWPDGHVVYVCNTCDGMLFSFKPDGQALCAGCGETHRPWSDE